MLFERVSPSTVQVTVVAGDPVDEQLRVNVEPNILLFSKEIMVTGTEMNL